MKKVALIFPGQGSQYVEMGKDLFESYAVAKEVFNQAADVIAADFQDIVFNGPAETLTTTAYCQPAILTTSIAALKCAQEAGALDGISIAYVAGLSLGEYSALTASGALSFEQTLKLVKARSAFMEQATKAQPGKMAAVIGLDKEQILKICQETGAEVANFNSPQQTVITGKAESVVAASEALRNSGAKNVVPLDVAGAFHSSLMQPAADQFADFLKDTPIQNAQIPLVGNVDAQPSTSADKIKENLAKQITSSVCWVDSVQLMIKEGVSDFIEIGPGKILKGLMRRTDSSVKVYNLEKADDVNKLKESLVETCV